MACSIPNAAVQITPDDDMLVRNEIFPSAVSSLIPLSSSGYRDMSPATPKITSSAFFLHLPLHLSHQPLHLTLTQLLPSTTLLIHITTSRSARLSDALVLSMPRGAEVLSSRLEGLGGLDEDVDRLARLLGTLALMWRELTCVAKKLGRPCFVSGDFAGIAREVRGEVVSVVCRTVEEQLKTT